MTLPVLTMRVRAPASATIKTSLDRSTGRGFQEHLNDAGGGQFTLGLEDVDVADVAYHDWVDCLVDDVVVFTWRVENIDRVDVSNDEEVGQTITYSGRGVVSTFERAVVYPAQGIGRRSADSRQFNFASAIDRAGLAAPIDIEPVSPVGPVEAAPYGWPDPDAWWVWSELPDVDGRTPPGDIYLHAKFVTTTPDRFRIFVTCDAGHDLWLDEAQIMFEQPLSRLRPAMHSADVSLDAGAHYIGVKASNDDKVPGDPNPAAFACTVYRLEGSDLGDIVLRTGPNVAYPAAPDRYEFTADDIADAGSWFGAGAVHYYQWTAPSTGTISLAFPAHETTGSATFRERDYIVFEGVVADVDYPTRGPDVFPGAYLADAYWYAYSPFGPGDYTDSPDSFAAVAGTTYTIVVVNWSAVDDPYVGSEISLVELKASLGGGDLLDIEPPELPIWGLVAAYPATPPGMPAEEIMGRLVAEAQTRGTLDSVVTPDWEPSIDGPEVTVSVGADYLSVLKQLVDTGTEFRVDAAELTAVTLELAEEFGAHIEDDVTLAPQVNLERLEHEGTVARQTNALLVRFQNGYIETDDSASVAEWDRQESFLSLGTDLSEAQAQGTADSLFVERAQPERATTVKQHPALGPTPFVDYGVGDWITAPDDTATLVPVRVMALTASENDDGVVDFIPELNSVRQQTEERLQRWLKRMAPGSLGGVSESAAPPLPVPSFADAVELPPTFADSVDVAGDAYAAGESPVWDDDAQQFVPGGGGGGGGGLTIVTGVVTSVSDTGGSFNADVDLDAGGSLSNVALFQNYGALVDDEVYVLIDGSGDGNDLILGPNARANWVRTGWATLETSNLTVPADTVYKIPWDSGGGSAPFELHATVKSRLVAQRKGTYLFYARVKYDGLPNGSLLAYFHVRHVGSAYTQAVGGDWRIGTSGSLLSISAPVRFSAPGDYIELVTSQHTGVNQTIYSGTGVFNTKMYCVRLGDIMSSDGVSFA